MDPFAPGFGVHVDRGVDPGAAAPIKVVRFSRTVSDGNPIRDWDRPFPAVDTATVWGLARGQISADREPRTRCQGAKFIRNPETDVTLWRIRADRLRSLTHPVQRRPPQRAWELEVDIEVRLLPYRPKQWYLVSPSLDYGFVGCEPLVRFDAFERSVEPGWLEHRVFVRGESAQIVEAVAGLQGDKVVKVSRLLAAAERQHLVVGEVAFVHQQTFVGVHNGERPVVDTDVDEQVLTLEVYLEPKELGVLEDPLGAERQGVAVALDLLDETVDDGTDGSEEVEVSGGPVDDSIGDQGGSTAQSEFMLTAQFTDDPAHLGLQGSEH